MPLPTSNPTTAAQHGVAQHNMARHSTARQCDGASPGAGPASGMTLVAAHGNHGATSADKDKPHRTHCHLFSDAHGAAHHKCQDGALFTVSHAEVLVVLSRTSPLVMVGIRRDAPGGTSPHSRRDAGHGHRNQAECCWRQHDEHGAKWGLARLPLATSRHGTGCTWAPALVPSLVIAGIVRRRSGTHAWHRHVCAHPVAQQGFAGQVTGCFAVRLAVDQRLEGLERALEHALRALPAITRWHLVVALRCAPLY